MKKITSVDDVNEVAFFQFRIFYGMKQERTRDGDRSYLIQDIFNSNLFNFKTMGKHLNIGDCYVYRGNATSQEKRTVKEVINYFLNSSNASFTIYEFEDHKELLAWLLAG